MKLTLRQVKGGTDPDETSNNGETPVGDASHAESVQRFFNLDIEQQAETLIRYQQHLSKVVDQNRSNGGHDRQNQCRPPGSHHTS